MFNFLNSVIFGVLGLVGFIYQWFEAVMETPRWFLLAIMAGVIVSLALYGRWPGFIAGGLVLAALGYWAFVR